MRSPRPPPELVAPRPLSLRCRRAQGGLQLGFVLVRERVSKTRPPVPFNSSKTLSGVDFLTRTNRAELPGAIVAANSFMKLSLIPTSVRAPETAPAVAPMAKPSKGFRKIRPIRAPQKLSADRALRS